MNSVNLPAPLEPGFKSLLRSERSFTIDWQLILLLIYSSAICLASFGHINQHTGIGKRHLPNHKHFFFLTYNASPALSLTKVFFAFGTCCLRHYPDIDVQSDIQVLDLLALTVSFTDRKGTPYHSRRAHRGEYLSTAFETSEWNKMLHRNKPLDTRQSCAVHTSSRSLRF